MAAKDCQRVSSRVPRAHYLETSYLSPARLAAYSYQLREILALAPSSVLEIGTGSGLVAYALNRAGVAITTLDCDARLEPGIAASVTNLPLDDSSYDVVSCFEVLEHLPWDLVSPALAEIHRVCRSHAVISLPDAWPAFRIHISLLFRWRLFNLPFWCLKDHEFDGEHYWEINKKGFPLEDILGCINQAGFEVLETFRPWESPCHRFFRLKRISSAEVARGVGST